MENYIQLISSLGFPIVVALWFMFRTEKVIAANTESIKTNTIVMNSILDKLK